MSLPHALRQLARRPSFTWVVVGTLGLGIGAATTVFSVVNTVVLRPLSLGDPESLVRLLPDHVEKGESDGTFALADLAALDAAPALAAVAGYYAWSATLDGADGAVKIQGAVVTPAFFEVLGLNPFMGRFFTQDDGGATAAPALVLGHDLWMRLGANQSIVGDAMTLNGMAHTVVGVAGPGLEDAGLSRGGQSAPELWRSPPPGWYEGERAARGFRFVTAIARLRPGNSLVLAQEQAAAVFRNLADEFTTTNRDWGVRLVPLKDYIIRPVRLPLQLLTGMAVVLLLLACANVANLFLMRATEREHETAVRISLGASAFSIARARIIESGILAVLSGTLGVALAFALSKVVSALAAGHVPRLGAIELDPAVLLFALVLSGATAVFFGVLPVLRAGRIAVAGVLKEGGRGPHLGPRRRRSNRLLLTSEVALTILLLATASLLGRSFGRLMAVDPGFDATNVLTLRVDIPPRFYESDEAVHGVFDRLEDRVSALPGVTSVGLTNILPLTGGYWSAPVTLDGLTTLRDDDDPITPEIRTASAGFFRTMGIKSIEGRLPDRGDSENVAVVNAGFARDRWQGGRAIGNGIEIFGTEYHVIGVVEDVRGLGLERGAEETVYLAQGLAPAWLARSSVLTVATLDPLATAEAVRNVLRSTDPGIPVYAIETMASVVDRTVAPARFRTTLLGVFAAIAFLLAGVGVYSVLAYLVEAEKRDIGIRIALGASPADIARSLFRTEVAPLLGGIGVGLIASILVGGQLRVLLFEVRPVDPGTMLAAVGLLLTAAVAAAYRPIKWATSLPPGDILRD